MTKREQLAALYARVPEMQCRGRCQDACGPIGMSTTEREQLEAAAARPLRVVGSTLLCSMLDVVGRCSGYAARPLICRLWGAVETMRCPWGCKPERLLADAEARALLEEVKALDGRVESTLPGGLR